MEQLAEDEAEVEVSQVAQETMEEAEEMEVDLELAEDDLLNIDVTNNHSSAGKETDASSTKRTYTRLNNFYQDFLATVTNHPTNAGLPSMDVYLPNQANDYVNRKLVRLFIKSFI
jgi:hypothetical protein